MSAIAFPSSPSDGQVTSNGLFWWRWNATTVAWEAFSPTLGMSISSINCGNASTTTDPTMTVSAMAAADVSPGDHVVTVHTGNGHGNINTKIRRFTTILANSGTAIKYRDSSAYGAAFMIQESGLYEIVYSDKGSTTMAVGVSVNTTAPSTVIASIPVAECVIATSNSAVTLAVTRTMRLFPGDVIRPHTDGNLDGTDNISKFSIRKIER